MRRISPAEAEYRQRLGDLIRRARKRRDWSQTYLGDRIGVTRATIAKYENGESEPGTYLIAKLHEQLGIKLEAFAKPPPKHQTVEEPLSEYLVDDEVDAAVEEVVRGPDRRQQDRREP
jgi:transcriptional regulator with XRE-family HTH domain